jgi:hypothetical protein
MRNITRRQLVKHHEEKLENNLPMNKMKKACKKAMGMTTNNITLFFWEKNTKEKKTSMVKKNQENKSKLSRKHKTQSLKLKLGLMFN